MTTLETNLNELLEVFEGNGVPNDNWVKNKLKETLIVAKEYSVRKPIECTISPLNGRMLIESTNEKGSDSLDKWIEANRYCFDNRLDIDIYAH